MLLLILYAILQSVLGTVPPITKVSFRIRLDLGNANVFSSMRLQDIIQVKTMLLCPSRHIGLDPFYIFENNVFR